jgi:predicted ATPase/DNA-binding SARP family transcriptional activator
MCVVTQRGVVQRTDDDLHGPHGGHTTITSDTTTGLRLQVLGPLQLFIDGESVGIPGLRRRSLLARLALARATTVLLETLIDDLWPNEPPAAARRALNNHVWRLRRHLGPFAGRLQRSASGCRLDVEPTELDLLALEAGVASVRATPPGGDTVDELEALIGLWRGEALVEFAELPAFAAEIAAIGELRAQLVDELTAALLAAGRARAALDTALRAAIADPLRERTHRLLMSALAAEGRTAEAMRTGRAFRRRLMSTTGLDPSDELDELEQRIASGALKPVTTSTVSVIPTPALPRRPATTLIGRAAELAELGALVDIDSLITITGPGGVGKTRLGFELLQSVAAQRSCAVVTLAGIETADSVPLVAAMALGLRPTGGQPPLRLLSDLIGDDRWLIVVDNCEHLRLAVRSLVEALIGTCPNLTVVATSRQPLGVVGERLLRLTPLDLPALDSGIAAVERSDACRLFLERAGRTQPDLRLDAHNYEAIAGIARGLDGLPLAIELAASRMTALSVHDLHARLDRTLALLHGNPTPSATHHASLRATLEWSYRLLEPDAQQLLSALSLFSAGFTLDAAESIGCGIGLRSDPADAVAQLVDASLIEPHLGSRPARYRMLETVRSFGQSVLDEAGQRTAAERANRSWVATLVESIAARFGGPDEAAAVDLLLGEHLNLHGAHERARASGDVDTRRHIIVGLLPFVHFCEIPDLLAWQLHAVGDLPGGHRDVELLAVSATAALNRGRPDLAATWARRSLELAGPGSPHQYALDTLGTAAIYAGRLEEAIEHLVLAATVTSSVAWRSMYLSTAGLAAGYAADVVRAAALNRQGAQLAEECGSHLARALNAYVAAELTTSLDTATRIAAYERAIDHARTVHAGFLEGVAQVGLASAQLAAGRHEDALRTHRTLIEHWMRTGSWIQQWTTLRNVAEALALAGDHRTPVTLLTAASHAPAASALSAEADERFHEVISECEDALTEPQISAITAHAVTATGPEIVTTALGAIDNALGDNDDA